LNTSANSAGARPGPSIVAGLFFLSSSVLLLEVLESRILALVFWHHLAFMVISIAMLGIAAAGSALAVRSDKILSRWRQVLILTVLFFIASLLIGHVIIGRLPFGLGWTLIPGLITLYLLLFIPFAFAGMGLVLPFRLYPSHSGLLYTASMIGSGAGVLIFSAGLSRLGAERLLVLAALLAAGAGLFFTLARPLSMRVLGLWSVVIAVLAALFLGAPSLIKFRAFREKAMTGYLKKNPSARVEATGWTPYCRIDVVDVGEEGFVYRKPYPSKIVFQDGDYPTLMLRAESSEALADLADASPYSAGYLVNPRPKKVLIIGAGCGLDAHLAVLRGVEDVTVVEINPFTIDLVRGRYSEWSGGIYDHPRVRVVNAEGRSFLSRSREKYDLILVNMVDTYTSLVSGAYVLTESYLYTEEAMGEYLDHLADGGAVAFFRFRMTPPRESLRLVALMVRALGERGAADPERHVAAMSQQVSFVLLVKKEPFTRDEVFELRQSVNSFRYPAHFKFLHVLDTYEYPPEITAAPYLMPRNTYTSYMEAVRDGAEAEFHADYPFDLAGITDDSPYFFKDNIFVSFKGRYYSSAIIHLQIVQSGVLALLLVLWPLRKLRRSEAGGGAFRRGMIYFGGVGFGYLLIEIALMQKLVLFLGNPAYSLSVTLTALLVSSGAGAMLVEKRPGRRPGRLAAVLAAALSLAMIFLSPHITGAFLGMSLFVRIATAVALIFPLGFVMGIPFPSGLRNISEAGPDMVPWAWGTNNAAGIMAGVLCVPIAMEANFTAVLVLAAFSYVAAAVSGYGSRG
jgi:spermidine synthase